MGKNKDTEEIQLSNKELSYSTTIIIYVVVALVSIIAMMGIFSRLIERQNRTLTYDISSLISEKMNNSLNYMIESVEVMGSTVAALQIDDFEQCYASLQKLADEDQYIASVGLIDGKGQIYGYDCEATEFAKWNLIEQAIATHDVTISEPYRAARSGKMVLTVFKPIMHGKKRVGTLFVTYPLSEIQNMAKSKVLIDDAEIYIMNANSGNIILCSGGEQFRVGNWNNTKLTKQQIDQATRDNYEAWEQKMRQNEISGVVEISIDGVSYTQIFEQIRDMHSWFIVVRVPNKSLSETIRIFQRACFAFVVILLVASLILFGVLRYKDVQEKNVFKQLSIYDSLTGILNRRAFEYQAQERLKRLGDHQAAVIFFDIDHFKSINDTYGHDVGDQLLIDFSKALMTVFDKVNFVGRLGGDEFLVMIRKVSSKDEVDQKMLELRRLAGNIQINGDTNSEKIHFSAGVVMAPDYGKDLNQLIKCADNALYQVKKNGRDGYLWYSE